MSKLKWPSGAATKAITGLPDMPKNVRLDRPPAKKGSSTRRADSIILEFFNGYLRTASNPKGHLAPVYIAQTGYTGFTVRLDRSPYSVLGYGYRKAEKLAFRLALRGHKRVAIRG